MIESYAGVVEPREASKRTLLAQGFVPCVNGCGDWQKPEWTECDECATERMRENS